jgi:hypothetical protein
VLFKAQDFYWLTILFIIKIKIDHFLVFEAFWWEKVCVCVFSCEIVVIMHCVERKGTSMMLWQHEFFMVIEPSPRGPPKPYVYQALEFRVGVHLPEDEVERMVRNQQKEVGMWCRLRPSASSSETECSRNEKGLPFPHGME